MRDRYVILGLAPARSDWFRTVGQWAAAAVLPAEFVRCVSLDEVRARLRSGRLFSAVLVDGAIPGLDRDVIADAAALGVAVLVVEDAARRDWRELGAAAVLASRFSRDELLEILGATAVRIGAALVQDDDVADESPTGMLGDLLAVTGPGGTGASTVAIALAQALAAGEAGEDPPPSVLLADLCRRADQAMLHDARVVVPSIQEVVEAHRTSTPTPARVLDQTFAVPARGYRLLLGLRRPRHWVTLRPRAVDATLLSLRQLADVVVADFDADLEGEAETGSVDVEERNLLARATVGCARAVVVVLEPSMKGIYAGVRTVEELVAFGVEAERLVPVINRAPRRPSVRAELQAALGQLATASVGAIGSVPPAVFLPERGVDQALRDGVALPAVLGRTVARAIGVHRERVADRPPTADPVPVPVAPGSLSTFSSNDRPTP